MDIVIVHGNKIRKDGSISFDYKSRLDTAINTAKENSCDLIVITGGSVRKGFESDSYYGFQYIKDLTDINTILEQESKTSVENILFTVNILKGIKKIGRVYVVSSDYHILRLRYLYKNLFKVKFKEIFFVGSKSSFSMFKHIVDFVILLYYLFDIYEEYIPSITKKIFRSGG